jgi:membrane protein
MFGFSLRSFVWPLSISLAFLTESVRSTLIFSNINGILLLALCGYFFLLLRDKQWWAGVVIGVAILIKPLFLPLLFLPLAKLQWRSIVMGLVVPVLFNLAALPLIKDVNDYSERLLPYLSQTRDYFNSSLPGIALYYGMPTALKLMLFAVFAAAVAVGVIMLLRWRYSDPLFWMTTTSTLLLSGVFFLSSLGQMYYSMMFFPMMFTVVLRKSVLHSWVAWVAVYCFFSPDSWVSHRWYAISRWTAFTLPTVGWGLLILVIATAAATWWWNERRSEG